MPSFFAAVEANSDHDFEPDSDDELAEAPTLLEESVRALLALSRVSREDRCSPS